VHGDPVRVITDHQTPLASAVRAATKGRVGIVALVLVSGLGISLVSTVAGPQAAAAQG